MPESGWFDSSVSLRAREASVLLAEDLSYLSQTEPERILPSSLCVLVRPLANWVRPPQPWGRQSASPSLWNHMLNSSGNTFTDTPSITFQADVWGTLAQPS